MSGRDKAAERRQDQLAQQQMNIMQQQVDQSNQRTARMDALQKPYIDYTTAATKDPLKLMRSTMGGLFDIDRQTKQQQQSIFDMVPEGAARDTALAQVAAGAPAARTAVLNNEFMQALSGLAALGGNQGEFGLQQLGAGLRAGEGAAQTNNAMMQAAAQRKAATMGAIGQAAGLAGSIWGSKIK